MLDPDLARAARRWADDDPDPVTALEVTDLLAAGDSAGLRARFAGRLAFGTAGLRGPLRAGPDGMNRAVVRRAAAGLAAVLHADATGESTPSVVVGYDARHGSADFARDSCAVLAGAGVRALLLPGPLPTPVLAFAVRRLGTAAGVMVTASHNPACDNGYKVYAGDGAQIVPPLDTRIEAAIAAAGPARALPLGPYTEVEPDIVSAYVEAVAALPRTAERDVQVAYTPLHGVGAQVLSAVFARAGFPAPLVEPSQAVPDPDFPTVPFPNPEEAGAMDRVLALAAASPGVDLVIANDPDADRCAVACQGRILTGDELGALLADHVLRTRPAEPGLVATTIVSSSLLARIAAAAGVPYAQTLTGFKWIMRAGQESGLPVRYGYEEALGYAVAPDLVRDKDGISAALLVAELAAGLKARGATLLDRLDELSRDFGVHVTDQLSVRVDEPAQITAMMRRLRAHPVDTLGGRRVLDRRDLLDGGGGLPATDAVVFTLDGGKAVVRPSGTEPKLKAYLEVVEPAGGDPVAGRRHAQQALLLIRGQLSAILEG